jgi:3-dehydroquinate synthase
MNLTVRIPTGLRKEYRVEIQPGVLERFPKTLKSRWPDCRAFLITDSNVRKLYGRKLLSQLLLHGVDALMIDFPAGEKAKSADVVSILYTAMLDRGIRRDSLVVALGGGVVGDVAGFVAATVLRGIKYIQIPTTLLAQVDSSVGGKVGIDHPLGKNLIGAFYQPSAVYIDPLVLHTLPEREYTAGLSEVVKIAAALDASFFRFLERNIAKIRKRNPKTLSSLIERSVRLKAAVVEKDEFETGLRKTLNLGHTIGHAVEAASDYRLRHGEAVAIGLVAESRIARDMALLSTCDLARLLHLMNALGIGISLPRRIDKRRFLSALAADKKSVGDAAKFVLLKRIGCTAVGVDVPSALIESILRQRVPGKRS